jgi:hypothetical protein
MLQPADFRALALALPDCVEGAHQGHPDFRCNGRVFASLHPDGQRAMVKVAPVQQARLVQRAPDTFTPASGAWGRAGCTMVTLANAGPDEVQQALTDAWQVAKAAPKSRPKRAR